MPLAGHPVSCGPSMPGEDSHINNRCRQSMYSRMISERKLCGAIRRANVEWKAHNDCKRGEGGGRGGCFPGLNGEQMKSLDNLCSLCLCQGILKMKWFFKKKTTLKWLSCWVWPSPSPPTEEQDGEHDCRGPLRNIQTQLDKACRVGHNTGIVPNYCRCCAWKGSHVPG